MVQHQHAHDDGFARAGRHFESDARQLLLGDAADGVLRLAQPTGDVLADVAAAGDFVEPHGGFDRLALGEKELAHRVTIRVSEPEAEQFERHPRRARIARFAPLPHLRPDEIDQKIAILAGQIVDLEDGALNTLTRRNRLNVGREDASAAADVVVIERTIRRGCIVQQRFFVWRVQNRIQAAHDRIIEELDKCREEKFIAQL